MATTMDMPSPVYEIRTTTLKYVSDDHARKYWKSRREYSNRLIGIFQTEFTDSVKQFVEVIEYGSLEHVFEVRRNMKEHDCKTLATGADYLRGGENVVCVLVPDSPRPPQIATSKEDPDVFELQIIPDHTVMSVNYGSTVIGRFLTIYGPSRTEYRLLRYTDATVAFSGSLLSRNELPHGAETKLLTSVPTVKSN